MNSVEMRLLTTILCVVFVHAVLSEDSGWSECSRPCDTGLSNQTVSCLKTDQSCSSIKYQYKLCNKQPCLDVPVDYRHTQCEQYNMKPFRGVLHNWLPLHNPKNPCILMCRTNVSENWLTMKLQDKVYDGTSCEPGADDVCIGGKCLHVGCDGIVESELVKDKCGVCGGTGADCSNIIKEKYSWKLVWLPCSQSCGTGLQKTKLLCLKVDTEQPVPGEFCPQATKPHEMTMECFNDECDTNIKTLIPDCEGGDCSKWITDDWTQCPVTCGKGNQFRVVTCEHGGCPEYSKPTNQRVCYTGIRCSDSSDMSPISTNKDHLFVKPSYQIGNWSQCSATCETGVRTRMVECKMFLEKTQKIELLKDNECPDVRPADKEECDLLECTDPASPGVPELYKPEPTYMWKLGNYSECSKSCLAGKQFPIVSCSDSHITVDTAFCSELILPVIKSRICNDQACPPRWDVGEYGPCTAECGGGVQERPVECVVERSEVLKIPVQNFQCTNPIPISKRNCNSHFCPSMWKTRRWSDCSSSCGVGLQTRRAFCVKSPIAGRQVTVSDTECMGPKPITSRKCHLGQCFGADTPPPVIKSEDYTYVQFRRSKRVRLVVGGHVVLLPGQSAVIKCPVKHFQRKLIFWSKGYKLISMMAGRVHSTFTGNLKLRKSDPKADYGTYTCSAGTQSASVTIEFQSKREANKKSRAMHLVLEEANKNANLVLPINDEAAGQGVVRDPRYNATKQLVFTTGPWSDCSKTCGSGVQTREVKCTRITYKYMKMLHKRDCFKWGLQKPEEAQKCLIREDCPSWELGRWSKCNKDQCVRDGYAQKKRPLHCIYSNGTRASLHVCGNLERPEHKMECSSFDCYSAWRTTKWTECLPRCASKGFKSRSLTCVWKRSKKPAWSSCKGKPRPIVKRICTPKPCVEECKDTSRYCNLVGMLRMCRYSNFRYNCCGTCQEYIQRNPN